MLRKPVNKKKGERLGNWPLIFKKNDNAFLERAAIVDLKHK
jgi:hypothetical protein